MGKLFRAKAIVTSNKDHDVFIDGFLAVDKDKIVDVGPWKKRPRSRSFTEVDATYGMITPGLFNLHTHLPMTLLRGIAEDLELKTWLYEKIFPLEKKWVKKDFVAAGTALAACESIRNGVTFVSDMYYFQDEIAKTIDRIGLRGMIGQTVLDFKSPDSETPEESFEHARKLAAAYKNHPKILAALAPHAPYTCSPSTLKQTADVAKELNIPIHIHMSETKSEFDEIKKKYGMTPVAYAEKAGLFECSQVLMAHAVCLDDSDFERIKKPNLSVVLNTQCNAKIASGIPPISSYLKHGIRFAVGTDGPASNNNIDIFSELNFFSKIHHLSTGNLTELTGQHLFDAATIRAAEAVGLSDKLGSLEAGKQADFIIIDTEVPHLTPLTKPYSYLIFSVQGPDVESTYVAGECLMKNRKIKTVDESKVLSKANAFWSKIKKAAS